MLGMHESLRPWVNQIALFSVCGDAEAWIFDVDQLTSEQRTGLLETHLAAFAAQLRRRGIELLRDYEPFALLGTSMPDAVQRALDLSAPHEGAFVRKKANGAVFYVAAADDLRGYFVADDVSALQLRESARTVRPPIDYRGTPTTRTGFTLEQYAIGGNPLTWTMSKHRGVIGLFERMFGKA